MSSKKVVIITLILSISCFSCEKYYEIKGIKESQFDGKYPIFYSYTYNKKLDQILEYHIKTDYGIYIQSIFVNPLKDRYMVKYNVYDTINQTKYETTNLQMFEEIINTKLPSDITLFQYVLNGTFIPDGFGGEIESVIINVCEQKNIKYYNGQSWNYEMWGEPDDDWVNTFYCTSCDTIGWRGI